jgi:hypothetical protein
MPRKIQPYCPEIVRAVERATILSLGTIAKTIAAAPPGCRAEAFDDARLTLTEQFVQLGRGSDFVATWVEIAMTALRLLVAAHILEYTSVVEREVA